jgi:hypothetical protein
LDGSQGKPLRLQQLWYVYHLAGLLLVTINLRVNQI